MERKPDLPIDVYVETYDQALEEASLRRQRAMTDQIITEILQVPDGRYMVHSELADFYLEGLISNMPRPFGAATRIKAAG